MTSRTGTVGCTIVARNYIPYARVVADGWRRHPRSAPVPRARDRRGARRSDRTGSKCSHPRTSGLPADRARADEGDLRHRRAHHGPEAASPALPARRGRRTSFCTSTPTPTSTPASTTSCRWRRVTGSSSRRISSSHRRSTEGARASPRSRGAGSSTRASSRSANPAARSSTGGRAGCAATASSASPWVMHADQRWLDFVPSYFEHHVLRDPGVNVAQWNLHERRVRRREADRSR